VTGFDVAWSARHAEPVPAGRNYRDEAAYKAPAYRPLSRPLCTGAGARVKRTAWSRTDTTLSKRRQRGLTIRLTIKGRSPDLLPRYPLLLPMRAQPRGMAAAGLAHRGNRPSSPWDAPVILALESHHGSSLDERHSSARPDRAMLTAAEPFDFHGMFDSHGASVQGSHRGPRAGCPLEMASLLLVGGATPRGAICSAPPRRPQPRGCRTPSHLRALRRVGSIRLSSCCACLAGQDRSGRQRLDDAARSSPEFAAPGSPASRH